MITRTSIRRETVLPKDLEACSCIYYLVPPKYVASILDVCMSIVEDHRYKFTTPPLHGISNEILHRGRLLKYASFYSFPSLNLNAIMHIKILFCLN